MVHWIDLMRYFEYGETNIMNELLKQKLITIIFYFLQCHLLQKLPGLNIYSLMNYVTMHYN